jgi:arginyl-tRNA synthetase
MSKQSLIQELSGVVSEAFASEGLESAYGTVRVSDRPDLAQFQCNGAMSAAKAARKNPRQVAEAVVARLQTHDIFSKVDIAGPGFINLNISDEYLGQHVTGLAADDRCGVAPLADSETVVLDYGGPNVAKPMHVGHLRSSIIGDSVRRILKFSGYNAIGDIHMGDWGTQMGMMISELELQHPEWPYFDPDITSGYPAESPVTMEDLEEIYPRVSAACKVDEARLNLSRQATVELQNKRPGYYALWKHFVAISLESMKRNFDYLNVHFDLWKGETDVHDLIAPMVECLTKDGYAVEDDGAVVIPVKRNDDNKEYPPLILYKRDGGVMYGTTDLATLLDRMKEFNPHKVIYVVDQRQSLHFEQVFRAARITGIVPESVELTHAGFGTMNGTDGKPFKTRAGGVMKLEDLIAMGIEKANQRLSEVEIGKDFSAEEKADIAQKVAIAAIKFADLQNNRTADYVFDLDRLTSFEGKTGPYLLYQAVRIRSLLDKAGIDPDTLSAPIQVSDADRKLSLALCELPEIIDVAARNYTPHVLCDHAFRLAQEFSSFYATTHVISESDPDRRASLLMLCTAVYRQLHLLLTLLGLLVPRRM